MFPDSKERKKTILIIVIRVMKLPDLARNLRFINIHHIYIYHNEHCLVMHHEFIYDIINI